MESILNRFVLISILLLITGSLTGIDILDVNFFVEPNFEPIQANMVNFLLRNIKNDSISQFNIFAGRILGNAVPDSVTLTFLNFIKPDLASPTDFHFYDFQVEFNLLMTNVECDSVPVLDRYIIQTDSLKIGIISVYTPDWTVINNLPEYVNFEFNFFERTKQICKELAPETNFIILLSNLSKYVDKDLVNTLPIDVVVSFDYVKTGNIRINRGKTSYYSVLTKNGKYGKLRLTYSQNKVTHSWQEVDFQVKP